MISDSLTNNNFPPKDYQLQTSDAFFCLKPCLTLELESKDRARSMKVSGKRKRRRGFITVLGINSTFKEFEFLSL